MADGKRRDEWDRASLICAQVTNSQATKRADLVPAWRFHPYEIADRKQHKPTPSLTISDPKILAQMMGVKFPQASDPQPPA